MALANSDGYWARASDYNLYLDERGRFHVIPHDVNEGLTDESSSRGGPPPGMRRGMPPAGGPAMFGRGPARVDVSGGSVSGNRRCQQAVAFEAARGSSAPGAIPQLRARDRRAVARLADAGASGAIAPRAHRRRCQGRYQETLYVSGLRVGCQRGEREPKKFCYSQACLPATGEVSCKQSSNAGSA